MSDTHSVPTVKEVAERCGVSQATVSRVLNNNYKYNFSVSDKLREKITSVAEEIGYRPNLAAKNLVQRQTKMIGILGCNTIFSWTGNLYQLIIDSAVKNLHVKGYNVCINVPNLENDDIELPSWRIDGAIVLQECSQATIDLMERTNMPYIVVNGVGGPNCSSVNPDDIEGTQRAIAHLIDLGHTRIAYAGPTSEHRQHQSIKDRHDTYISELSNRGLKPVPGHDKIFRSAPAFLAAAVLKHHATAILAYDHIEALKLLHGANVLDIRIPKQLSLVCFNDEYLCDIVTPPLTTVAVPARQLGRLAAEMILKHLDSPEDYKPKSKQLPQDLIVRASTEPLGNSTIP